MTLKSLQVGSEGKPKDVFNEWGLQPLMRSDLFFLEFSNFTLLRAKKLSLAAVWRVAADQWTLLTSHFELLDSILLLLLLYVSAQGSDASRGLTAPLKDEYFFSSPFVCFCEFRYLPGSHSLDYSVSFFFLLPSPQELRLLAPARSFSHAHAHTLSCLTGYNIGWIVVCTHTLT